MALKEFQKKAVKYIDNHSGLMLVYGTGVGKTLTAVTAGECFLDKNPNGKVVFVGPASLLTNFKQNLENYKNIKNPGAYHIYSFDKFMSLFKTHNPVDCKNTLMIIDEAHNYRNYLQAGGKLSKRFESAMDCAMAASKRLLLTATPFVNKFTDFISLINFLHGKKIVGNYAEYARGETEYFIPSDISKDSIETLKKLLKDKVDFIDLGKDLNFPTVKEHFINIPMTLEYQNKYDKLIEGQQLDWKFTNPNKFYNAHRRAVNLAANNYYSLKLNKVIDKIRAGKAVIFTNWIDFGVKPVKEILDKNNISYRVFSGKSSKNEKEQAVSLFNKDKIDALVITRAGGEGLDLKGVRNLLILDPVWHESGLLQIIGRAVRYKSHEHLPIDKRHVDVWKLVLINNGTTNWKDPDNLDRRYGSGDALLYNIIERKQKMNEEIIRILKSISIK